MASEGILWVLEIKDGGIRLGIVEEPADHPENEKCHNRALTECSETVPEWTGSISNIRGFPAGQCAHEGFEKLRDSPGSEGTGEPGERISINYWCRHGRNNRWHIQAMANCPRSWSI